MLVRDMLGYWAMACLKPVWRSRNTTASTICTAAAAAAAAAAAGASPAAAAARQQRRNLPGTAAQVFFFNIAVHLLR